MLIQHDMHTAVLLVRSVFGIQTQRHVTLSVAPSRCSGFADWRALPALCLMQHCLSRSYTWTHRDKSPYLPVHVTAASIIGIQTLQIGKR